MHRLSSPASVAELEFVRPLFHAMICPVCHLHNPPEAWRCDCEYDFRSDATSTEQAVARQRFARLSLLGLRVCFAVLDTAVIGMGFIWVLAGQWRVEAAYGFRFGSIETFCLFALFGLVFVCWSRQPRLARIGLAALIVGVLLAGLQLPSISYR